MIKINFGVFLKAAAVYEERASRLAAGVLLPQFRGPMNTVLKQGFYGTVGYGSITLEEQRAFLEEYGFGMYSKRAPKNLIQPDWILNLQEYMGFGGGGAKYGGGGGGVMRGMFIMESGGPVIDIGTRAFMKPYGGAASPMPMAAALRQGWGGTGINQHSMRPRGTGEALAKGETKIDFRLFAADALSYMVKSAIKTSKTNNNMLTIITSEV